MITKLLKYDLKSTYKVLSIFYLLAIIASCLTRIFFVLPDTTIINIIYQILSGVTIAMLFNVLINTLTRNIVHFEHNLYKDESYLTHTLPVSKTQIYLAKFLNSIISLFTSMLVILITVFIAYYSKENFLFIKESLLSLSTIFDSEIVIFLTYIILIFTLEILFLMTISFTGIILGHRKNNNKIAYSFLYGFIIYMLSQGVLLLIMFVTALFSKDIMNIFLTNNITNYQVLYTIIILATICYLAFTCLFTILNIKLFERGVNVD